MIWVCSSLGPTASVEDNYARFILVQTMFYSQVTLNGLKGTITTITTSTINWAPKFHQWVCWWHSPSPAPPLLLPPHSYLLIFPWSHCFWLIGQVFLPLLYLTLQLSAVQCPTGHTVHTKHCTNTISNYTFTTVSVQYILHTFTVFTAQ